MRASSRSRYGKRLRTRRLMPPPHGLLRGNAARSSRRTGTPREARARAAVAPAGPAPTTITESDGEQTAITAQIQKKCAEFVRNAHYKLDAPHRLRGCVGGRPVG